MNQDKTIAQIALYAALIAALGLLPKFNIPLAGGVPITAQSLGIMLAGVMLGPVRGALAVCLFLFVVALGAPLLAGGRGGSRCFCQPQCRLPDWIPICRVCRWRSDEGHAETIGGPIGRYRGLFRRYCRALRVRHTRSGCYDGSGFLVCCQGHGSVYSRRYSESHSGWIDRANRFPRYATGNLVQSLIFPVTRLVMLTSHSHTNLPHNRSCRSSVTVECCLIPPDSKSL